MMGDSYRRAQQEVLSLGELDTDSEIAMNFLRKITDAIYRAESQQ
jgi:hypothetical protein